MSIDMNHGMISGRPELGKFVRFGLVGGVTALIYFAIMGLMHTIFEIDYRISVSAAYLVSTAFHYLANRNFTFGVSDSGHGRQFFRYATMWGINYLVTMIIVAVVVEQFYFSPYIGVVVSVSVTMVIGFFLSRYWVFKVKEQHS